MGKTTTLVRKQVLLQPKQVEKLEQIAGSRGVSITEVVRQAIDAYDPDDPLTLGDDDLTDVVAKQVRDALNATRRANRQVKNTLQALDKLEGAA